MTSDTVFPKTVVLARISTMRNERGWTQTAVDKKLGWRSGLLHDYESGRLTLTLEACWSLLNLYDFDWQDLFAENDQSAVDELEVEPTKPRLAPFMELGLISPQVADAIHKMRQDPILTAELGMSLKDDSRPLLPRLLEKLTYVQRRDFFVELCRYVNSTIAVDRKILPIERSAANLLMQQAPIELQENERKSLLRAFEGKHLGGSVDRKFPRVAHKHFLIWVLFIVAFSDGELNHLESEYICEVSEHIGLEKKSFLYIRDQLKVAQIKQF